MHDVNKHTNVNNKNSTCANNIIGHWDININVDDEILTKKRISLQIRVTATVKVNNETRYCVLSYSGQSYIIFSY